MRQTRKPIKFTQHAKNRLRWRKISLEGVAECLASPDFQESAPKGKTHLWKRAGQKFLRVTFKEEEAAIMIITAVLKRKPPKGWIL